MVIEEFPMAKASFIVMVDGEHVLPMATSGPQARRRRRQRRTPAAWAPIRRLRWSAEVHQRVMDEVIYPTVRGMAAEGNVYTGFLYAGLMIDKAGKPKVIEFNCRFGDRKPSRSCAARVQPGAAGRGRAGQGAEQGRSDRTRDRPSVWCWLPAATRATMPRAT